MLKTFIFTLLMAIILTPFAVFAAEGSSISFLGTIFNKFGDFAVYIAPITAVITACAGIAAITPTKIDNTIFNILLKILNVVALNVGKAKNADDK